MKMKAGERELHIYLCDAATPNNDHCKGAKSEVRTTQSYLRMDDEKNLLEEITTDRDQTL